MPLPRYQSGLSDAFGAPGVYIKELAVSAPVRGIFAGVTGIVGECVRGPVGRYVEIRSMQRFIDVYGGRDKGVNGGTVNGHVWRALQAGPYGVCYIARAAAAAAATASFEFETLAGGGGVAVLRAAATSPGTWGNDVLIKIENASDATATKFNLTAKLYGRVYGPYPNLNINTAADDNLAIVLGSDDGNPVVLTKLASGRPVNTAATVDGADADGFVNLGEVVAAFTSVAGTDGVIADADFTGAGKAMEIINAVRGVDHWYVAGRSNTAIKTKKLALTATANNKLILCCPDSESVSLATAVTEVGTLRNKRLVYAFNHAYMIDPITTEQYVVEPIAILGSILSQTEPDVHPGVVETAELTQGVVRLYNEMSPTDTDTADLAAITYLNRDLDADGNQVFIFGNGRTTSLTNNDTHIDGQRSKFFLVNGLAKRMRGDEKKPNTPDRRNARKASFEAWLTELAADGGPNARFVATDETTKRPQFEITNDAQVNSQTDWDAGIQRDVVRVKLIPKGLYLQLQIQMGTDVKTNFDIQ
jgi:hypothetical protein